MLELTLSKKHEKVKVDIHTSTNYWPSYMKLWLWHKWIFFWLLASGFKWGLSSNPCVWKSGRNHFLDLSESSISSGQSDFKVYTNQLCQPIRKGLELLLPGWGSWKWEWRARLWSKDGNHEQSWKTLVEETQEGDFCSLHWHFFAIVDQLSISFLLTTSAQRVPEPDPLPGISFNTRPNSVLEIIG